MFGTHNRTFGHAAQTVMDGAVEFKDAAIKTGAEFKDAAIHRTSELTDAAFRKGAEFKDAAVRKGSELTNNAFRATADTYEMCRSETDAFVRANPYRTALVAFSIGALLGVCTSITAMRACSQKR